VIIGAVKEVGGPSFFALLVIAVSFIPVLALEAQEGRLFKPLAYTKNLGMIGAAVLAITLDPALRLLLTHLRNFDFRPVWLCRVANAVLVGRIHQEEGHPVSRVLVRGYEPVVRWSLRRKWWIIGGAAVMLVATVPVFMKLGTEFMPPLDEGALFYMPSTMPGISISEAQKLLQATDRIIRTFPEVDRVLGKAGRAETSTDPAPLSMLETVIILKPKAEWRKADTWYSVWAPSGPRQSSGTSRRTASRPSFRRRSEGRVPSSALGAVVGTNTPNMWLTSEAARAAPSAPASGRDSAMVRRIAANPRTASISRASKPATPWAANAWRIWSV
jgi:Cu(I)/Ag(I) efflux system membrane protein CusA/SilA